MAFNLPFGVDDVVEKFIYPAKYGADMKEWKDNIDTIADKNNVSEEDRQKYKDEVEKETKNLINSLKEQCKQFVQEYLDKLRNAIDMIKTLGENLASFVGDVTASVSIPQTIVAGAATGAPNPGWGLMDLKAKIGILKGLLKSADETKTTFDNAIATLCIPTDHPICETFNSTFGSINKINEMLGMADATMATAAENAKNEFKKAKTALESAEKAMQDAQKEYDVNQTSELKKKLDEAKEAYRVAKDAYDTAKASLPKDENITT